MGLETAGLLAMIPSMAEVGAGLSGLMGSFGGGGLLGGLGSLGTGLGSLIGLSGEGGLLGGLGSLGIPEMLGQGILGGISGGPSGAAQGIMSSFPGLSAPTSSGALAGAPIELGTSAAKSIDIMPNSSGTLLPGTKAGTTVPPAPSFGQKLAKAATEQILSQGISSLMSGPQRRPMPQIGMPDMSGLMTPPMTFAGRPTYGQDYGVPRMPQPRGYF